jgi:ABC-2 type transport system ATP-binding protein
MPTEIEACNLVKRYGTLTAVDGISLSIYRGDFFGLLGPNGSGKTTIVKMLTGQTSPTRGSAFVGGIDVVRSPLEVRTAVGIVPEQETPPSFLTAEEYLHFVGSIRGLPDITNRCEFWYNLLDFADQKDILCKDLSRGTKQKVMVAQAFLHHPNIAFVDEPLINLDPLVQRSVKQYLCEFVDEGGTIFLCTHALEIAQTLCTRVGIIYRGAMVYQGTMQDVTQRYDGLEDLFLKKIHEGDHVAPA